MWQETQQTRADGCNNRKHFVSNPKLHIDAFDVAYHVSCEVSRKKLWLVSKIN